MSLQCLPAFITPSFTYAIDFFPTFALCRHTRSFFGFPSAVPSRSLGVSAVPISNPSTHVLLYTWSSELLAGSIYSLGICGSQWRRMCMPLAVRTFSELTANTLKYHGLVLQSGLSIRSISTLCCFIHCALLLHHQCIQFILDRTLRAFVYLRDRSIPAAPQFIPP
ncbi:unnamed protein product [Somion occarium]|uniref:Uncharacterized protein n=1 Tax=Somion occarium TaxID=3059160 RepID=A0ABP1DRH4_9APHY